MNNKAAMIGLAVLAFLVAAVLVLLIVRMLFGGRLRMPGGRARQARLGIVDAFDLDRQRQLIIVRRDNTEHLIMIGGPNDILIESEIVRVEARDLRDQRRGDKGEVAFQGVPGFGEPRAPADGRIPAPPPAEREMVPPPPPADEPLLPLPEIAAYQPPGPPVAPAPPAPAPVAPPVARTPTFPLPPRRPAPVTPPRPAPAPLRLPDSVTRNDDIPMPPAAGPAPLPPPPAAPQPAPPPPAPPVVAPVESAPAPAVPPRPTPPPFLKPRPPIRPLQRTTPQAPVPPASLPAAPEAAPKAEVKPAPAPAAPPPSPKAAPKPPVEEAPQDALESLEEEMAKLLGRGP